MTPAASVQNVLLGRLGAAVAVVKVGLLCGDYWKTFDYQLGIEVGFAQALFSFAVCASTATAAAQTRYQQHDENEYSRAADGD